MVTTANVISLGPPPATSTRGIGRRAKYRASCSISDKSTGTIRGLRGLSRLRGSLAQRTLPALQLTAVRCGRVPGAPALRDRPAAPCHPQPLGGSTFSRSASLSYVSFTPRHGLCGVVGHMAKYDESPVPRGT